MELFTGGKKETVAVVDSAEADAAKTRPLLERLASEVAALRAVYQQADRASWAERNRLGVAQGEVKQGERTLEAAEVADRPRAREELRRAQADFATTTTRVADLLSDSRKAEERLQVAERRVAEAVARRTWLRETETAIPSAPPGAAGPSDANPPGRANRGHLPRPPGRGRAGPPGPRGQGGGRNRGRCGAARRGAAVHCGELMTATPRMSRSSAT
jgi:hypothetical protein